MRPIKWSASCDRRLAQASRSLAASQAAFSLLEVMIAIAILGVLIAMTTQALVRGDGAQREVAAKADATATMNLVLQRLSGDISVRRRNASAASSGGELFAEPYVAFGNCRRGAETVAGTEVIEQYCTRLALSRRFADGTDREVTYETQCVQAPVGAARLPAGFGDVVNPCRVNCRRGQMPVIVITGATREVYPSGYRSRAVSVQGAAVCFTSRIDVPLVSRDGDLQVDIGTAFTGQNGKVRLKRRTLAVPLSPYLAASLTTAP